MTYIVIECIQALSVFLLCIETLYIFQAWKTREHAFLFVYSAATLINNLGYLLEMTATNSDAALLATKVCYFGKVFIPLSLFCYILRFCGIHVKRSVYAALCGFHVLTFLLVLTCRYNHLYYTGWTYVSSGLFPHNVFGHGPFYFLFTGMLGVYLLIGLGIVLHSMKSEKIRNRRAIDRYFIASALVEGLGFAIFLTGKTEGYDCTSLSYLIATIFMFLALFRHDMMDTLDLAKNYALDNLSEGIIALDESGQAFYSNAPADHIFPEIKKVSTRSAQNDARQAAADRMKELIDSGTYLFQEGRVYKPEMKQLFHRGKNQGRLYVISDITDSYNYYQRLEQEVQAKTEKLALAQESIVTGMATMIESRDNSTGGHIRRTSACVAVLAKALSESGKYPEKGSDFWRNVVKAAPMHDLGKIAVDDAVLRKPEKYTPEEFETMKSHAARGAEIVADILKDSDDEEFRTIAVNVAHYHHEKWDGTGYPCGMKGPEIPLEARIMALADVFDALVSKRCYKDPFTYDEAFEAIQNALGTHFDPKLGEAFLGIRPELEELYDRFRAGGQC